MIENNILFILAEGPHDTAFMYRILKANGFREYNKKIKDFPKPLDSLLQKDILNVSIPDENIQNARNRFLPSYVMQLDNNLIVLYSFRGDTDGKGRISLINTVNLFNIVDEEDDLAYPASPNTSFNILYLFDADEIGTNGRMNQIKGELVKAFPDFTFATTYSASTFHTIEDMKIGAYIFREEDNDKGMLEDVLLPLMQDGNDDIFEAAETFLAVNHTCNLFDGKLILTEDEEPKLFKVNGKKYFHRKSLIGTVGQLQKSGSSNVVCISQADYLNNEKIKASKTCNEILDLIKTVMI